MAPYWMADRYAYMACLSWAVLAGGVLSRSLRVRVQKRSERRRGEVRRVRAGSKRRGGSCVTRAGPVPGFFAWETFVPYRVPPHFDTSSILAWLILILAVALANDS